MSMVLHGDIYVLSELVRLRRSLGIRGLNGPLYFCTMMRLRLCSSLKSPTSSDNLLPLRETPVGFFFLFTSSRLFFGNAYGQGEEAGGWVEVVVLANTTAFWILQGAVRDLCTYYSGCWRGLSMERRRD